MYFLYSARNAFTSLNRSFALSSALSVFVFDPGHDKNAVAEARKLNLPIIAICDTNANPMDITHPIPSNDDAIKTLQLIADYVKAAVEAGKAKAAKPADKTEEK